MKELRRLTEKLGSRVVQVDAKILHHHHVDTKNMKQATDSFLKLSARNSENVKQRGVNWIGLSLL
jgi:hypothetical protein